jgi:hypothetical protein
VFGGCLGVLKLFEGTGELECVVATIKTPEGSLQKVVDGTSFSIGRAPDCVLSIPHAGISRLHVLVTVKRGELYIMDQESSNGTFLNGAKIEARKLIHIKPTDEIKFGLSDVTMQFVVLEKHFKTDYIAESLLPASEKDNLLSLIKASNHKAQEIISSAQAQSDHILQVSNEKARSIENQSLLKQEEIISSAQVEGQHFVSESKRKAAQILLENEDKVKASCKSIYDQAERIRKEAEVYFQNRVKDAEVRGTEIIEHHTKLAKELVEDLKEKTIQKTEQEVKENLAGVIAEIEDKSKYLSDLKLACSNYEANRKNEIEIEVNKIKNDFLTNFEKEKTEKINSLQLQISSLESEYKEKNSVFEKDYLTNTGNLQRDFETKSSQLENNFISRMAKLDHDYSTRSIELESEYSAKFSKLDSEYKKKSSQLEKNHLDRATLLESDHINRSETLEKEYNQRMSQVEADVNEKTSRLEGEYSAKLEKVEIEFSSKCTKLEEDYATRFSYLESSHSKRISETENEYSRLKIELDEKHKLELEAAAESLVKQKQMLDKEVQSQRQELVHLTSEHNLTSTKYVELKTKFDEIQGVMEGLQTSEAEVIRSLNEKRELVKKAEAELVAIKNDVDVQHTKFVTTKDTTEAQIEEYQQRLAKLKAAFEAESLRLKKESEQELAAYNESNKKIKEELDQQLKQEKSEIHRKTMDYMDSERARMDDYRAQILQEKKDLDQAFEKTKKEFEFKTKEIVEIEKNKIDDARQSLINNLNRERQVITDDVIISIMKIKNHEDLTASAISDVVARVFNAHVTDQAMSDSIKTSGQNINKLKLQYLGYGIGFALVAFLGFKFLIQPQVNRHIVGTEEHAQATVPVERAKYVPPQSLEYKESYTDAVLYTLKFANFYLDDALHDKWFKHVSSYMYENWRVDETKTIEAVSISKTLVQNLRDTSLNLDAEFYQKGIEKMRELEDNSEKRMIEILGTKVKYEAFRRKEHEFFEPYIQNQ